MPLTRHTTEDKRRAVRLRARGVSNAAIAAQFGVNESTIRSWCGNIKQRRSRAKKETREERERRVAIAELRAQGYSEEVIRANFG